MIRSESCKSKINRAHDKVWLNEINYVSHFCIDGSYRLHFQYSRIAACAYFTNTDVK